MRFEVAAAFAIGLLLPALETLRRGLAYWSVDATTMLEDYLAGALLLVAAVASLRRVAFAAPLLLTAWAAVSYMMLVSLVSQVEDTVRAVDLEPNNEVILCGKLMICAVCLAGLAMSFRAVRAK